MRSEQMYRALLAIKRESDLGKREDAIRRLLTEAQIDPDIVSGQLDAVIKLDCAIRFRCAHERGLVPGKLVMYSRVALPTWIKNLKSTGYVKLYGVPNNEFDPQDLILLDDQ